MRGPLTDMSLAAALPPLLADGWGIRGASVEPLGGGMNSATATVATPGGVYVAKWVPAREVDRLARGCAVAATLAAAGMSTGAPLPALEGALTWPLAGGTVALGVWAPGDPLTGDDEAEQTLMGHTLARAHLITRTGRAAGRFASWLDVERDSLGVESWLRPAYTMVMEEYAALPPLTWATLHTDPSPEAFRFDAANGTTSLIDWTGAEPGPVLYDVASAVMYLGGPEHAGAFVDAFRCEDVMPADEWVHLDTLRRGRWLVQAAYFAERLAADDLTGTDAAGYREGFDRARRGLRDLGVG
ncbi:phosphotransferase [Nocardioides sp. InS609-2]|uniref:phosphotransferase enzyme family protein n=1 Tax=Nocardioides sp. InS609-2 TaxID=2760705 RepID=UPI0020BDAE94|nr:phosphotransferase [Nocardioides sp. InS609-2]